MPSPGWRTLHRFRGGCIYFTVSLENSVYRSMPEKPETRSTERYWTLPGSTGNEDGSHINGLRFVGRELRVSGIGRKRGESWTETTRGFVYNIEHFLMLADWIPHPHSTLSDGKRIWTCSSQSNQVLCMDAAGEADSDIHEY